MNEKYIKNTIKNLCEEASAMLSCGKRDDALDLLNIAARIISFESWNRGGFFSDTYAELADLIKETAENIVCRIVFSK